MKRILGILLISFVWCTVQAQTKFGPVVNMGLGFYSNNVNGLKIKSTINPSFGLAVEKYVDFWFSVRTTALYSFRNFKAEQNGTEAHINGQFVDLTVDGIFSESDNSKKFSPYGSLGLGVGIDLVSKGQDKFLINEKYASTLPFFTVVAGMRFSTSILSTLDLSLNYNRGLVQPISNIDARFNQISLKVITFF